MQSHPVSLSRTWHEFRSCPNQIMSLGTYHPLSFEGFIWDRFNIWPINNSDPKKPNKKTKEENNWILFQSNSQLPFRKFLISCSTWLHELLINISEHRWLRHKPITTWLVNFFPVGYNVILTFKYIAQFYGIQSFIRYILTDVKKYFAIS